MRPPHVGVRRIGIRFEPEEGPRPLKPVQYAACDNVCERALKKAILHRKNVLFYRTAAGAQVGDLFMSLIHTYELAGANPFDYLTELQRHANAIAATPAA
jgi:hypothetical protein